MNEMIFTEIIGRKLRETPPELSSPIIIVADKTRVCEYPRYLPVLIGEMRKAGMNPENLRILIAYGTHSPQNDAECLASYGDIYRDFNFIHHDCHVGESFVDYGYTSRGTPIRLRRDIMEASYLITMGPICHHYFAGYGGGRKLIFPGCGEKEAIYANHGLFLDSTTSQLSPNCQPGVLDHNPLADDLFEYADIKEADLAIHGIMNSQQQLCDILVGTGKKSYRAACQRHGALFEIERQKAPLILASCGGYPKDINFIQSHKALHNSSMFVEDGGTLIFYGECRDDIGSTTFLPWFKKGGFGPAFKELGEQYQGNGGTALAMMTKTSRIKIKMVTSLTEDICNLMGVEKIEHEEVQHHLHKTEQPIPYIGNGSLLVRRNGP